jgi:uncharacterized protein (DUF362 family)
MEEISVQIYKTSPSKLITDVEKSLQATDFSSWNLKERTFVKINGNYDKHYPGSNTSPWFLNALLKCLRHMGFENLIVIEGNLPYFSADQMIQRTGLIEILKSHDVIFLNYEGLERDENDVPLILQNAQVINVPVPHGHGFAVISCAVKNLFGLLPNPRRKYHRNLSDTILSLNDQIKPFTIVDATVGLVGPSTRRGTPTQMDLIISGWDAVAIDVMLAKMMGYDTEDVPHLKLASQKNRISQIEICGDYDLNNLPMFSWPLKIDASRKVANWLESTWIEDLRLFQAIENWLERIYHHITFWQKRKMLFSGPWMEYEHKMNEILNCNKDDLDNEN